MRILELKSTLAQIMDLTAFTSLTFSGVWGLMEMLNITNVNPTVFMAAVGGFIIAVARSYVHVSESRSKLRRERLEIEQIEADMIAKNMQRLFNKTTTELVSKDAYNEAIKRLEQYNNDIEQILSDQKRLKFKK